MTDGHQLEYNEFQETAGGVGGPVMSCQGTVPRLSHAVAIAKQGMYRRVNSQKCD